ncbi:hypothetical protein BMF90_14240 [Serratia sp. OLHL2]|uniref:hypothetical protein n=1 Tax=Serratia TaxID=613 RepID=UPI000C17D8B8|nr:MULTISPECIES: hypothetical protein [Serratia]PII53329.1 hypothetical protein BMF87_10215 [Serratia sp. OLEL1]PII57053.1 hypothetical protein BMF85_14290 [Serratia sp. OLCL1]PII63483.1 hypothetical protein BMF90_14240 [Serratia sp. OLHL2]PII71823.1 hypothetical protein BMF88_17435 [Serratia sp. OLDL1]PII92122.1 hypothetical protein BMF91_13525 [Serratia sp. OLFL2]
MSQKQVPIFIPAELECVEANDLACLRFHYHLKNPAELPIAGELFTGLTLEQAKDTVVFLQNYIQRAQISQSLSSKNQTH